MTDGPVVVYWPDEDQVVFNAEGATAVRLVAAAIVHQARYDSVASTETLAGLSDRDQAVGLVGLVWFLAGQLAETADVTVADVFRQTVDVLVGAEVLL